MDTASEKSPASNTNRSVTNNNQTNGTKAYIETQEKGFLNSTTTDGSATRFLGSSSGVYFLQSVKAAFLSGEDEAGLSLDEQVFLGEEDSDREGPLAGDFQPVIPQLSLQLAEKLIMPYFRYFHPLFPFVDGKQVRHDLKIICIGRAKTLPSERIIVLKAIFSIGCLEYPECEVDPTCYYKSSSHALSAVGMDISSSKYDTPTIQAYLAVQVFLVSRMFMQSAYELCGVIRSKIHLAGLHRCPARYPQLSEQACIMRKRIYWSAYAIDRQLSQSLGLPIGYQDSDVDVCTLDSEHHMVGVDLPIVEDGETMNSTQMLVAIAYAQFSTLTGQVIEMFNKAMHTRNIDYSSVLELKSQIESWRNRLPCGLVDDRYNSELPFENSAFFNAIYCHLNILTHRPRLSLEPGSAEFKYAIQVCIDNSRRILLDLTWQCTTYPAQSLFWPGYLSMVWMAGLMIAYASRIGYYPTDKATEELSMCLPLCQRMSKRWRVAQRCEHMLKRLMDTFHSPTPPSIRQFGMLNRNNKRPFEDELNDTIQSQDYQHFGGIDDVFELFNNQLLWKEPPPPPPPPV